MSEAAAAAEQLRQVYEGPAWHGPSLRELLDGVDAALAAAVPAGAAHSIQQLVGHVAVWEEVCRRRLGGEVVEHPPAHEGFPRIADDETAWRDLLERLEAGNRRLREAIASLPESRLQEIVPGNEYTVGVLIRGVAFHSVYHGGQVALLKRMLSAPGAPRL